MGNQGTYSGPFRRAVELIRGGEIGEIKEVHVWNTGGGADRKELPKGELPVPAYLELGSVARAGGDAAVSPAVDPAAQSGASSVRASSATGGRTAPTWPSCP